MALIHTEQTGKVLFKNSFLVGLLHMGKEFPFLYIRCEVGLLLPLTTDTSLGADKPSLKLSKYL